MATNGDQRLEEQLQRLTAAKNAPAAIENEPPAEFTFRRMAEFLAEHGRRKQELTEDYARELTRMVREELAYLERIIGKGK